jgi:hypothetical protein
LLCLLAACAKKDAHDHTVSGTHVHTAPHGGTLIELGEHAFSLELVRDAAEGKLTAYVLDGHAENFVRIKGSSFDVIATVGGETRPLTLKAVANTATGETVGDTSQFETQADWLKTTETFDAVLPQLDIRGSAFTKIALNFPKGKR